MMEWLGCFPCVAFLLCTPPEREKDCIAPFHERGLSAEVIGTLDDSGLLRIAAGGETATVLDLRSAPVTGLPPES